MDDSKDRRDPKGPSAEDVFVENYLRTRREGAFLSPFGTEGCQWDGFPEPPEDEREPD